MLLNYLSRINVVELSIDEFYDYLEYLHSIGVSYELIDMIALIYTEHDNINIYDGLLIAVVAILMVFSILFLVSTFVETVFRAKKYDMLLS